jgi:hypothetical protein
VTAVRTNAVAKSSRREFLMKFEVWHAFVLGAILSWGAYVPVLHEGQTSLGGDIKTRGLRAFLCVGIAYFLTAVVVPVGLMLARQQPFEFTGRGVTFTMLGGVAGAAGALCIVLSIGALPRGDSPLYIAPLVFAGAPIVNVIVSLAWKTKQIPGPVFFVGIVLAALGAGLVLYAKNDLDERLKHAKQAESGASLTAPASSLTTPQ